MAKKGVWGERTAIIVPVLYKRVTCATCIHYCHEDHSCLVSSIIPKINGIDYWKNCKKFVLSPEYHDEAHKRQVMKVKGDNFFERCKYIENDQIENPADKIEIPLVIETNIPTITDNKPKTFAERFVEVAKEKHQIELEEIPVPMLPGLNNIKCYVNSNKKLLVMTMPKIKAKKINTRHKMSKDLILAGLWTRFLESLEEIIALLTSLNKSEEYEKWIVLPVFNYKDEESCGETFYKKRGQQLQGIKLVEMDDDGVLLFATGPIHDKYWTAERIKEEVVFKE